MATETLGTRGWTIVSPSHGEFSHDCLRLEERLVPPLMPGEVLVRTILLSIDPTSRNWLKLAPNSNPFGLAVGGVMLGQAISRVEKSAAPGFEEGDYVIGISGWADFSITSAKLIAKVKVGVPLEANLTIFSHIGNAAITGMVGVGQVREGETVVVSAAAGATGSIAAAIAKARGARVVGIAGGAAKCSFLTGELGLDAAIDYRSEDVEAALGALCPDGVDLFFDNVGGQILDAVLMNLASGARIAVCGQIALYDSDDRSDGQGVRNLMELVYRRIRMEGFLAFQMPEMAEQFDAELTRLFEAGIIRSRSHRVAGLENAPHALDLILSGRNEGKVIVEVSQS